MELYILVSQIIILRTADKCTLATTSIPPTALGDFSIGISIGFHGFRATIMINWRRLRLLHSMPCSDKRIPASPVVETSLSYLVTCSHVRFCAAKTIGFRHVDFPLFSTLFYI